jgi:hypothetical protein
MSTIDEGELDRLDREYGEALFLCGDEGCVFVPGPTMKALLAAARALSAEKAAREEAELAEPVAYQQRERRTRGPDGWSHWYPSNEEAYREQMEAPRWRYEVRALYAIPPSATTAEAETARLRERVKEMEEGWIKIDGRRVRHKTRGSTYRVAFTGRVQCATPINDMDPLVAYVGDDGEPWFRPPHEFDDGRFEPSIRSRENSNE